MDPSVSSPNAVEGGVERRTVLKAAGVVGLAAAAGATVLAESAQAASQNVDFWISIGNARTVDGNPSKITITVEVGNAGTEAATQPVRVILITPYYANFDHAARPYFLFNRYIVQNADPAVPEMMELIIPAAKLGVHQGEKFDVGLDLLQDGPRLFDMMSGYVLAGGDTETSLLNNEAIASVDVPIGPPLSLPPGRNPVNFFFISETALLRTGQTANQVIKVGAVDAMPALNTARFIYVSPYRAKINRNVAPGNWTFLHSETDVRIPDVVSIPVSPLNLIPNLPIGSLLAINIPLVASDRALACRGGKGFLAVSATGSDFDVQPQIAMGRIATIQPI
ncbi:hypothetical protein F4553_000175 [Allocatelliglobosispora scoriae]|uniref:Uncharacterized protein n=1 Tax=Allocatelliglobosispora scoriae TaxID=643052 RepID=A0A841BHZ5_9ACTN|nr:hypothetical protein [Allocatelliglobosispora scoriae]MBB5866796.1 hypothetical protein [Allocatelliglobosispora scoriae]